MRKTCSTTVDTTAVRPRKTKPKSYAREINTAVKALNLIDRLRERALEIVRDIPSAHSVPDADEFKHLSVDILDEEIAEIVWPWADGAFDEAPHLEQHREQIPVWLLFCDADELNRWRLEQWAEHNRKMEEQAARAAEARLEEERRRYETLKAKFEPAA